jgi:hypothetical protein
MIQELKLKLGGEERTFTFGIIFLGNVLERLDFDYNELLIKSSKNPFKYAPILMYESLKNTAERDGRNTNFTERDLIGWLESEETMGADKIVQFIQAFMGTNENKTPIEESGEMVDDNSPKKK